jgi:DNA-binding response OmpR family regulator/ribosomal protein S27E
VTPAGGRETRIVRCPGCRRYYRVASAPPSPGARLRCTKCGEVFALGAEPEGGAAPQPPRAVTSPARVLGATDGPEFRSMIDDVLHAAGFELRQAGTGEETWEAIGAWRPQVVLLDVALPGTPSFEICDRVRARPSLSGTGIILIASVFQQTRYKRAPTSLYGADDYVEKHHIRDRLPGKIARLLPQSAAASVPPPAPPAAPPASPPAGFISEREREALVREELPGAPRERQQPGLERLQESLRRFARIIVSDIALYNQDLVERGIREGTFTELLAKELDEGRRLYRTRVPQGAADAAYFDGAVREFIAARSSGRSASPARMRDGHGRA